MSLDIKLKKKKRQENARKPVHSGSFWGDDFPAISVSKVVR